MTSYCYLPLLGGAGIPAPPAGFGYVYFDNSTNQFTTSPSTNAIGVVFNDPSNGQTRPVIASLVQ